MKKKRVADKLLESLQQAAEIEVNKPSLIIMFNGKPHSRLNEGLLNKQDCWDNVPAIIEEHVNKLHIYEAIKKEEDPAALKCYSQNLTDLEFRLQELWGFPKDAKFHKFWWTPKCLCPKADGEDSWGTGYTYINGECPLHA